MLTIMTFLFLPVLSPQHPLSNAFFTYGAAKVITFSTLPKLFSEFLNFIFPKPILSSFQIKNKYQRKVNPPNPK
jgi:hypothetical protein